MPLDYVEVFWDRPRKIFYDWEQLENLGNALGGLGFVEIQQKMATVNLAVIKKTLWYGLRHYDSRVKESEIPAIIGAAIKKGVYLPQIVEAVADALNISQVLGENRQTDDGDGVAGDAADPTREVSRIG
jgi:hypothetical protein